MWRPGELVMLGRDRAGGRRTPASRTRATAEVRNFSLDDLRGGGNPDFVEVRGIIQGNGSIRATLLQRQEPDEQGLLRGRLTALDDPDFTRARRTGLGRMTFTTFFDDDEAEISAADFFAGAALRR